MILTMRLVTVQRVHAYTYGHECADVCTHTRAYACTHICMSPYMHTNNMYTHTYVHTTTSTTTVWSHICCLCPVWTFSHPKVVNMSKGVNMSKDIFDGIMVLQRQHLKVAGQGVLLVLTSFVWSGSSMSTCHYNTEL